MNRFSISYKHVDYLIETQKEHNLSEQEVEALKISQKAILLVELLGLCDYSEIKTTI